MGTQERRIRERKALKNDIVLAAKNIALHEGWNAVTIRKIAEKIEYSPPTIYEHFKDKDELLREIRREGYQKLLSSYQEALTSFNNPESILTQLGVAYLDFAWENPELYTVMYGLDGSTAGSKGLEEEIEQIRLTIKDALLRMLKESKQNADLSLFNWEDAIDILRCMLHGAITFSMVNGLRGDQARARSLAMKGIHDLVTHWMQEHNTRKY